MMAAQNGGGNSVSAAQQRDIERLAQAQANQLSLNEVLEPDRTLAVLNGDQSLVDSLIGFLPESQRNSEEVKQAIRSPQLAQALARISQILNSSQFGQLMASFSLPTPTSSIGVQAFIDAIQQQAEKIKQQDKDKDKDKDKQ